DVGAGIAEPDLAEDRGHVDDGATAGRLHRRELVAHGEEHAGQVDPDHLLPAVQRILAHGRGRAADPRVVHGDVQPAETLLRLVHQRRVVFRPGDVHPEERRGAPVRLDLFHRPAAAGLVDVRDHRARTGCRELEGDVAADAAAGPGDHRYLVLEHEYLLHPSTPPFDAVRQATL